MSRLAGWNLVVKESMRSIRKLSPRKMSHTSKISKTSKAATAKLKQVAREFMEKCEKQALRRSDRIKTNRSAIKIQREWKKHLQRVAVKKAKASLVMIQLIPFIRQSVTKKVKARRIIAKCLETKRSGYLVARLRRDYFSRNLNFIMKRLHTGERVRALVFRLYLTSEERKIVERQHSLGALRLKRLARTNLENLKITFGSLLLLVNPTRDTHRSNCLTKLTDHLDTHFDSKTCLLSMQFYLLRCNEQSKRIILAKNRTDCLKALRNVFKMKLSRVPLQWKTVFKNTVFANVHTAEETIDTSHVAKAILDALCREDETRSEIINKEYKQYICLSVREQKKWGRMKQNVPRKPRLTEGSSETESDDEPVYLDTAWVEQEGGPRKFFVLKSKETDSLKLLKRKIDKVSGCPSPTPRWAQVPIHVLEHSAASIAMYARCAKDSSLEGLYESHFHAYPRPPTCSVRVRLQPPPPPVPNPSLLPMVADSPRFRKRASVPHVRLLRVSHPTKRTPARPVGR